jgi:asparagine synthase (glutamine-hydrolysing)
MARPCESLLSTVEGMAEALRSRGPDGSGLWHDPDAGIALAHRLLSVADRFPPIAQPLVSSCGRYVLVCDGEIYNAEEMIPEVIATGRALSNYSDAAVLLESMAAWGPEAALRRLNTMVAGTLWDSERRELYLFRDRFGIRPLYWTEADGLFLFASNVKAFRACADFVPGLDCDTLSAYLRRRCVPGPYSIYRNVRMLEPGSILSLGAGSEAEIRPYWRLEEAVRTGRTNRFAGSEADAADRLDQLLGDVVARRTGGGPVGVFLSGGVDSSILLAKLQSIMPGGAHSFSIGFHERSYDEARQAAAVARHMGATHDALYLSSSDARDLIPRLPEIYDEPMADVAQIPVFYAAKLASRSVHAVFSGDGGDEFFSAYEQYLDLADLLRHLHHLPPFTRRPVEALLRAMPAGLWACFPKALPTALQPQRLTDKIAMLARLFKADATGAYRMMGSYWQNPDSLVIGGRERPDLSMDSKVESFIPDAAERMKYLITLTTTTDGAMPKSDRAGSAAGLEIRMPLMDHRLADFSWTLPPSMKLRGQTNKWLLRQVLYRYVPPTLVDRPKSGLDVPIGQWLRGPLREWAETLLDEKRLTAEGVFRPGPIRIRWQEHLTGHRNWGGPLWIILMFQSWKERWLP